MCFPSVMEKWLANVSRWPSAMVSAPTRSQRVDADIRSQQSTPQIPCGGTQFCVPPQGISSECREPQSDLAGRGLVTVARVHEVLGGRRREIAANGARLRVVDLGGA